MTAVDPATFDNNKQAVDIKGYRVLTDEDKAAMNRLKELEKSVLDAMVEVSCIKDVNHRSLAIAKTEMQTAFMWAVRAIARPNGE